MWFGVCSGVERAGEGGVVLLRLTWGVCLQWYSGSRWFEESGSYLGGSLEGFGNGI